MKKQKDSSNNVFEVKGMQSPSGKFVERGGMIYYLDYTFDNWDDNNDSAGKTTQEKKEDAFKNNLIRGLRTLM